jgi:hypothetical protein
LEEIDPKRVGALDAVIVEQQETGETVFQAIGRAARFPGVDPLDPALLHEAPEGRVPLENGRSVDLRHPDALGVASILDFEVRSAEYEAERVLVEEPRLPPEPHVPVEALWPALRAAGYHTGPGRPSLRRYPRPRSTLADLTGFHPRRIHRICAGSQKSLSATAAVTLLEALGRGDLAYKIEKEHLGSWRTRRMVACSDLLEYRDALARLALGWRTDPSLTEEERCAVSDTCWLSAEAQRGHGPDGEILTAEERIFRADEGFLAVHGRMPVPLSPRLRASARAVFSRQRARAHALARELRKGTPRDGALTAAAVYGRTHRLRKGKFLRPRSRPSGYGPPADWMGTVSPG